MPDMLQYADGQIQNILHLLYPKKQNKFDWGIKDISFACSFYTSSKSWRGYSFTAVYLCVCVCLYFVWTKFQPNRSTFVHTTGSLNGCVRTLSKVVTFGQRSRSQYYNFHFFFTTQFSVHFSTVGLYSLISDRDQKEIRYATWICTWWICIWIS